MVSRASELSTSHHMARRPDVLLCASRSSARVARWIGIPSFVIDYYEHANASFCRLTRSTILHPGAIDPTLFLASGISPGPTNRVPRAEGGHLPGRSGRG